MVAGRAGLLRRMRRVLLFLAAGVFTSIGVAWFIAAINEFDFEPKGNRELMVWQTLTSTRIRAHTFLKLRDRPEQRLELPSWSVARGGAWQGIWLDEEAVGFPMRCLRTEMSGSAHATWLAAGLPCGGSKRVRTLHKSMGTNVLTSHVIPDRTLPVMPIRAGLAINSAAYAVLL